MPDLGVIKNVAGSVMSPIVRFAAANSWSPTKPLGKFLTGMAMEMWDGALDGEGVEKVSGGLTVVQNTGIRRVMGLDAKRTE